jgi:hypothetical protein
VLFAATEAFVEFLDLASAIQHFLLTGIERVAFRAYFDMHFIFTVGRAGFEVVATAASHVNFLVRWVYFCFHHCFLCLPPGEAEFVKGVGFYSHRALQASQVKWLRVDETGHCLQGGQGFRDNELPLIQDLLL